MTTTDGTRAPRLPREQRRQQVLAAALEVFSSVGYHAASMDDIAERAGVSKPVLYQHFPGKLDRLRVSAMVNAYFSFVEEPGGAFRLVFESDLANEPAVRQRVDDADLELARLSAAVIAEDTGLHDEQALLLASGMQGMVQVAARRWLRGGTDDASREEAADLITSLAWRGISGFPLTHPPQDAP